jgi:hypothetical protein
MLGQCHLLFTQANDEIEAILKAPNTAGSRMVKVCAIITPVLTAVATLVKLVCAATSATEKS